jgi:hypothetical protein
MIRAIRGFEKYSPFSPSKAKAFERLFIPRR